MKHWYLIPLAAIAGLIAGAWGPTVDLEELKELQSDKEVKKTASAKSGFGAIATLANIPERAKGRTFEPPRRDDGPAAETNRVETAAETNRLDRPRPPRPLWRDRENLKNRIEDAKELWRTRCELARTQWKAKLNLEGERSDRFDAAIDAMNAELKELMAEFAEAVAEKKEVTPELGVKMMSAVTGILAESYNAVGECTDEELRGEVENMPLHDFIDPSFMEPMIQVQDYLEPRDFDKGPGPR